MNTKTVTLDVTKRRQVMPEIRIGQGDKDGTTLVANIYDNGEPFTLTNYSVRFAMKLPFDMAYYAVDGTVSGNTATFAIDESYAASVAGVTETAYVEVLSGSTVICSTNRIRVVCLESAYENVDPAHLWDNGLEEAIERATEAAEAAEGVVLGAIPTMSATVKGGAKLGDGLAVDENERLGIEDGGVSESKIGEGAVTSSKLASDVTDMIDGSVRAFDTVADMQAATDLEAGMIAHTNGFHASGDGGAAFYEITSSGTANGMDVLACGDVFANLVITESYVTPEMFGAWGDGEQNDVSAISKAKTYAVVEFSDKTYCVSTQILLDNSVVIHGNGCTICPTQGTASTETSSCFTVSAPDVVIENVTVNGFLNKSFAFSIGAKNCVVNNCTAIGSSGSTGAGFACSDATHAVSDIKFTNCVARNCRLGFTINGCKNIRVESCSAENCTTYSFGVDGVVSDAGDGAYNCEFSNCTASMETVSAASTLKDCFYSGNGSTDNVFSNCVAVGGRWGFALYTGSTSTITTFDNCRSENAYGGFYVSQGGIRANNCISNLSATNGFRITNSNANAIAMFIACAASNSGADGFSFSSAHPRLISCTVESSTNYDISIIDAGSFASIINTSCDESKIRFGSDGIKTSCVFIDTPKDTPQIFSGVASVTGEKSFYFMGFPDTNYTVVATPKTAGAALVDAVIVSKNTIRIHVYNIDGTKKTTPVNVNWLAYRSPVFLSV